MQTPQFLPRPGYDPALSILFLVGIGIPLLGQIGSCDRTPVSPREVVQAPEFPTSIQLLKRLPEATKSYIESKVGFRAAMIRAHGRLKVQHLGLSSSPQVLLGQDGWLFLSGERSLDNFRRAFPFSDTELQFWATTLEKRRQWLAQQGMRYVFVIMPDKETIYPEYMPSDLERMAGPSRREQLVAHLRATTQVEVIDLTADLLAAKQLGTLYFQTDTHWNARGAWVGATAFIDHLKARFPEWATLQPDPWEAFDMETESIPGGDLARLLGLKYDFQDELVTLKRREPLAHPLGFDLETIDIGDAEEKSTSFPGAPIPRVVAFRDSFAAQWIPLIYQCFEQAEWIWSYEFDPQRVLQARPQLVVEQWVERKLMTVPLSDPELPPAEPASAAGP